MLSAFRGRGFSSIVFGGLIIVTVVVFVVQFNPAAGKKASPLSRTCAATVKGHCIDPKDHRAEYLMLIPRDQSGNRLMKRAQQMGLPRIALDGLIERELLVAEAERIGLTVTEDEVTEYIYNGIIHVSVPSDKPELTYSLGVRDGKILVNFRDQTSKTFDMKTYKRQLKYLADRSETEFREEQERELLAAKMRDLVRAPVRVSEAEARESYIGEKSQATLTWIEVKQSYVARYALDATDAAIDAFANEEANRKEIDALVEERKKTGLPKENHVRHILVKFDPKKASASEKEQALAKISAAYWRIKKGEAFSDVARDVGQDGTSSQGGDLGDRTDSFVPSFRKVADALKPGELTDKAVETQFGYHLIMKDDPKKSEEVGSQIRKDAARELYIKAKAAEMTRDFAKKIGDAIKAGKTPEDAVKAQIATLKPLASAPGLLEILPDETLAQDAGAPAATDAGAPPKKTADKIGPDNDPDRPQVTTSSAFNRGGDPIAVLSPSDESKVLDFSFGAKDGDVMPEPVHSQDGFVVVQLKEHKNATKEDFDKERDTYMQTLLAAKQQEALSIYVRRLKDASKADIQIDEKYMEQYNPKGDGGAGPTEDDEEF
jgi:peptidyl-prolyl cis-trans isomerase D